jgi:NAD(P)-dependent dehydrogenase (short-subunit alcohol dehydrogenase family)
MGLLDGKVAMITGAGRGIGRGVALAFAEHGASVMIAEVDEGTAKAVVGEIEAAGGQARYRPTNVRVKDEVYAVVDATVSEFGKLDILVNNAMAARIALPFMEQTDDDMREVWEVGPLATFWGMQAAYPHLKASGTGCVINVSSGSGTFGVPGFAVYASAKEAIRAMSKCVALEWSADNIRINVVCPFAMSDAMVQFSKDEPEQFAALIQATPLGRAGDPVTDIGAAFVFFASDLSKYITAHTLNVDGGSGTFR